MLTLYLSGENLVTINGRRGSVHQRLHFFRKDGHVSECVAKPCFGMGFTNDKGKFSSLENLIKSSIPDMCTVLWLNSG